MFNVFRRRQKPSRVLHALDRPLIEFPSGDALTLGALTAERGDSFLTSFLTNSSPRWRLRWQRSAQVI